MNAHTKYLYDVAAVRRSRREGRITADEMSRRLSDLIHDSAGVDRPDPLTPWFDQAVELANQGVAS